MLDLDTPAIPDVTLTTFAAAVAPGGALQQRLDSLWPRYRDWFGGEREDLYQTAALAAWEWVLGQPPTEAETSAEDRRVDEVALVEAVTAAVADEVRRNLRGVALDFDLPQWIPEDSAANRKLGELLRAAVNKSLRQVGYTDDDIDIVWLGVGVGVGADDIAKSLNRHRRTGKKVKAAWVQSRLDAGASVLRQVAPAELAKIREELWKVRRGESSGDE